MKEIFFGLNATAALFAWFWWTVVMLSIYKDDNEKTWNFRAYFSDHWDNWAASLVGIPTLLFIGYKGFKLGVIDLDNLGLGDAYYLCSGFLTEAGKMAWKKWRSKNATPTP